MITFKQSARGAFSDRNEINKINTIIQKDILDSRTRNGIVNLIDSLIKICDNKHSIEEFYEYVYKDIFCLTKDELPYNLSDKRKNIVNGIKSEWEYHEIFTFL